MAQEIADSTLLDTWASSGLIVEPDVSKIIEGWQLGEQPPHEYMNWLQNTFGSKLNHILKNGVASWNNETEYLAGSSVQYNGNVWLCKATNTNSAPTDANANWKRIITVESLTTVLGGYVDTTNTQTIAGVKTFSSTISGSINGNAGTVTNGVYTTGNQTIAGIKTFSSSPIVPTPTSGTQATNKAYVDSVAVTPDASTTVKGIVELATDAEAQAGTDDLRAITPLKLFNSLKGSNQSLSASGYQKLHGGLIIQWGTNAVGAVTFPIAFPTNCYGIYAGINTTVAAQTSKAHTPTVLNKTTTSFTLGYIDYTSPAVTNYSWLAIGY